MSDLFLSFPVLYHLTNEIEILQDNRDSILNYWENKWSISIGSLISLIPELRDYFEIVNGNQGRTFPLIISCCEHYGLCPVIKWSYSVL